MFTDRSDAGQRLAARLLEYTGKNAVVLAIPRGGVVVGVEIASLLSAPLDLIIPRKIGAPGNPELAIGAVAGDGQVTLNEILCRQLDVSEEYIRGVVRRELQEIDRRRRLYLGDRPPIDLRGKIAIVTDDGLATGYTALAAVKAVRHEGPKKLVLAVPVAPFETVERLAAEVDQLVCLETPELFYAVGQFYLDFSQTSDEEVVEMLKRHAESLET